MNHVNNKTVLGLAVAAGIALIAAIALGTARKPEAEQVSQVATLALPELDNHLNEVNRFSITGPGQKLLATLEKDASGWTLKEKGGYRADAGKVREYLLKLGQSRLLEAKTANEQRYGELGVADIGTAGGSGVLLALDGLGQPVQLLLGNVNTRGDATFVRRAGDKQSWLAKGNLLPDKTAANWLDKHIVDLPPTRVREIVVTKPEGKPLRAFKQQPGDTNYTVADLPKGRELASEFAANALGTTLAGLTFDDVLPAAEAPAPADKPYRGSFAAFDGLVVAVTAWKKNDTFYAQLQARKDAAVAESGIAAAQAKAKADWDAQQAVPAAAEARPAAQPPLAVSDPAKDKSERLAALDAEVARLNQHFDGWTYQLPPYKFASLEKSLDEYLKPLDGKKTAAGK